MRLDEITEILDRNDESNVKYYLDKIIQKQDNFAKESNRLGLFMIIIIFLFYLIDNSIAKSIRIGPISIDDLVAIKIYIPLVLAFLILRYQVITAHNAELKNISKIISSMYFGANSENMKNGQLDDFTRSLLPISLYGELSKLIINGNKKLGCIGALLIIPFMLAIGLAPYYFEWIWLKDILINFRELNFYEKITAVLTIWLLIVSFFYLVQTFIIAFKDKQDTSS